MLENKNNDLQKSKEDIKEILTGEIMSRYFYQKGRIKAGLNFDIEVEISQGVNVVIVKSTVSEVEASQPAK